ncbi:MAG: hypothetical protein JRC93_10460 [Deltaproteobacteria bacterium]|nr:hypothetical protein [Deltaproteobacteria bacterium]
MFKSIKKVVRKFTGPASISGEIGVAGVKESHGYIMDEFLQQLLLERGRKTYREMRDNDATCSAMLFAIDMILRGVIWRVEENKNTKGTPASEEAAEWLKGVLFEDMSHSWDDFIAEVLSMLVYGWEYTEIVYKVRKGSDHPDPRHRSLFNDGTIGLRKLGNRAQETLERWEIDEEGYVSGMYQRPPLGGATRFIPIEKALHFISSPQKGSPEGRSVLRGAYRSWYFLKNIQEVESIAIERELNGLPVVSIPNNILNGTTTEAKAAKAAYVQLVRDIKFNDQGGVVLPSDTYWDADGKPTGVKQVQLELLASKGTRSINTSEVVLRYQREIARTVMADFLMLGSNDRGSFAMSKDKSSLFIKSTEGWLSTIADIINTKLITKLWKLNNFDPDVKPRINPGSIAPVDLDELGKYISDLSRAGAPLFPDDDLEAHLRTSGGLPEKGPDATAAADDGDLSGMGTGDVEE